MTKIWVVIFSLILFATAFLPRAYRLDFEGINPDEDTWHERIDNFVAAVGEGNWFYTQQSLHPAVTFEWLTAGGKVLLGGDSFWSNHYAMVWPIVLVTSLTVVGVFLLLLQLFDPLTSFVAAFLVALDPFFIAHSRVVQMDALLASFMILSALSFLVFQKGNSRKYLFFSAVMGGLAILTKLPALFLVPYILMVLGIDLAAAGKTLRVTDFKPEGLGKAAAWLGVAAAVFVVLYPAVWVKPILTVKNLIYGLVGRGLTAGGEGMGTTFYLGQIVERPGIFFYPIVLALRSTPITLVFGVIGGIWGFLRRKKRIPLFLILYSSLFLAQMTLVAKSGDRYLLPAFLGLDILAGFGVVRVVGGIGEFWKKAAVGGLLFVVYCLLFFPLNSVFLSYYNPLFGGGGTAAKLTVVGWGEGMREAAEYLGQKPNASKLKVAAFYPDSLQPYFEGEVWDICSQGDSGADYAVLYVNMIQRRRCEEFVEKYYEQHQPEYAVRLNGINYVYIYKTY